MNFQRVGSISNTLVGSSFETTASQVLASQGITVQSHFPLSLGVGKVRRVHKFDLGKDAPPIVVECKSHRWTTGGNPPSAKLTVWNEAMYYFSLTPSRFRRILFVLRDYSSKHGCTLAEYYFRRYPHLIPDRVEFWEFDESTGTTAVLQLSIGDRDP